MTEKMRKRLEEAADEHCSKYDFEPTQRNITDSGWEYGHTYTQLVKCFLAGAEYGFNEAMAMAKEWLKKRIGNDIFFCIDGWLTSKEFLTDFETDMNKLWEEQK